MYRIFPHLSQVLLLCSHEHIVTKVRGWSHMIMIGIALTSWSSSSFVIIIIWILRNHGIVVVNILGSAGWSVGIKAGLHTVSSSTRDTNATSKHGMIRTHQIAAHHTGNRITDIGRNEVIVKRSTVGMEYLDSGRVVGRRNLKTRCNLKARCCGKL